MEWERRLKEICSNGCSTDEIKKLAIEFMNESNEDEFIEIACRRRNEKYHSTYNTLVLTMGSDRLLRDPSTNIINLHHALTHSKGRLSHVTRIMVDSHFEGDGWKAYKNILLRLSSVNQSHSAFGVKVRSNMRITLGSIRDEYGLDVPLLMSNDDSVTKKMKLLLSLLYPEEV